MKKSFSVIATLFCMSPVLFGCKIDCEKVIPLKNDIDRIETLIKNGNTEKEPPAGQVKIQWRISCNELPALSAKLNAHRDMLEDELEKVRGKKDKDQIRIREAGDLIRTHLYKLQTSITNMCDLVSRGAENGGWSKEGRALKDFAESTIRYIDREITQQGQEFLDACPVSGRKTSLLILPAGSQLDPRVSGGQKGWISEPASESSVPSDPAESSGGAGSARG